MTNIEFQQAGKKLTGIDYGYQQDFSDILCVSLSSVKRWASGKRKVPLYIEKLIEELLKNEN
jgi:DNA-binding transcriptional regulator YiaG